MNVNVHMCTHVAPPALSVVHVDKMMYVCVVPGKVMNKKWMYIYYINQSENIYF